jgi:DNA-binding MarR family transcriptional regulator
MGSQSYSDLQDDDIATGLQSGAALLTRYLASSGDGLSLSARLVLTTLGDDGPTPLTALADSGGMTQPAMTQLVGRLARVGVVVRLIDPDDGRTTLVELTEAGRALLAKILRAQRDDLTELLEALSPNEEATLSLAMRIAAPLLDKLSNVAANKLHSNVFAP